MSEIVYIDGKFWVVEDGEYKQVNIETSAAQVKFAKPEQVDGEEPQEAQNVEEFGQAVEENFVRVSSEIDGLKEDLAKLGNLPETLTGLQATLTELQTGVSGLTSELESLKDRVEALETEPEKPEGPPETEGGDNGDENGGQTGSEGGGEQTEPGGEDGDEETQEAGE